MDLEACAGNFTGCLTSLGLKYCDVDKDVCQQRGTCITTIFPTDVSICMCSVCYYGARCEKELFSQNLWTTALATLSSPSGMLFATKFFATFFASIQIINSLLCLQTYFSSKKIRITNVGVYLILNGLISFILALEFFTQSIILWLIPNIPLVEYSKTTCLVDQKFVNATLTYIWGWSVFFIALERTLVECYHYSLYDSRKRSLIVSILVCIICGLTTIPGIFTVKDIPEDQLSAVAQVNLLSN
ncbi:hypothetical protein I4U23_012151 [Adineta vaga]|nr:hypothetical protein I4U23_012151 [Adineta vaga]